MNNSKPCTRRAFIDLSAKSTAGLIGLALLSNKPAASNPSSASSLVVTVKDDQVSHVYNDGSKKVYAVNQETAQRMVDAGIIRLTGLNDLGEAWKSIFPGITRDKVVGIKVNTIGSGYVTGGLSSHPEVAYSIANGLTQMQFSGLSFPEENIIIWDRSDWELTKAGFTINRENTGVKCYGTKKGRISGSKGTEYDDTGYKVNGSTQYVSKILTEQSDYLINLCLLKDHSICGITISLKNHYGTVHMPDSSSMHNNACNPAVPILNTLAPIRDKQVLCISDAIYGIISGGPNAVPQIVPNTMLFSKDSVALDVIGTNLLLEYRLSSYKKTLAKYIRDAAGAPYNLGNYDESKIENVVIENPGTGVAADQQPPQVVTDFRIYQNFPNPFNAGTTFSYNLSKPAQVKLDLFNLQGERVQTLVDNFLSAGYHRIKWDGFTGQGILAASGTYIAQFNINQQRQLIKLQMVK